jgi:hypothetical protein
VCGIHCRQGASVSPLLRRLCGVGFFISPLPEAGGGEGEGEELGVVAGPAHPDPPPLRRRVKKGRFRKNLPHKAPRRGRARVGVRAGRETRGSLSVKVGVVRAGYNVLSLACCPRSRAYEATRWATCLRLDTRACPAVRCAPVQRLGGLHEASRNNATRITPPTVEGWCHGERVSAHF